MLAKVREKERALELRRKGYSYRDILSEIPLAKSTLSMWLKDLPLTEDERRYLKSRRDANISRGRIKAATANRTRRLAREADVLKEAREKFLFGGTDPLFFLGISLYWAEGSKRNLSFGFTNSDPQMMIVMIKWIEKFLGIHPEAIRARLYTHKPFAYENAENYWSVKTRIPLGNFGKTIYKPTGLLVKKRPEYKGCLRIELNRTSYLFVMFWQQMLIERYGKEE